MWTVLKSLQNGLDEGTNLTGMIIRPALQGPAIKHPECVIERLLSGWISTSTVRLSEPGQRSALMAGFTGITTADRISYL